MKPIVRILSTFFVLAVVYTSCQNREWLNPFDPSCPKEIWTPTDFTAVQDGTTVLLTWNQPTAQISGFKITKSVDNGINTILPDLAKGVNQFVDNNLIGGKNHVYSLTAYAGNNLSNTVIVQITPVLTALVATTLVSAITSTSVSSGGNITTDGGATITARGVCWSTNQNPTISDGKTSDGTGIGSYNSSITGLNPGVTYYIRAYATNSQGTSYGNQVTASTVANLPVITTSAVSAVSTSSAVSGGNITSDGGGPVTARGVCWSTITSPTIANSLTIDGSGIGTFTSSITGIIPNTTYYVRAYSSNSAGTAYGNQISFTTLRPQITPTFAAIGPLCPNSTPPALPLSSTNTPTITGTWLPATISTITAGTSTFTFTPDAGQNASIATISVTIIAASIPVFAVIGPLCQNSAAPILPSTSTNGIIGTWSPTTISTTAVGVQSYTFTPAAGQCATTKAIDIYIAPSITPTFTSIGPLTQNSTAPILPLTSTNGITGTWSPSTVNTAAAGTLTYTFNPNTGQCASVATMDIVITPLTVTDADGNVYNTVTIGTQVWMASNLKVTKFNDNTPISLVTDNVSWVNLSQNSQKFPLYCWYDNVETTNKDTYGALYNWNTVNAGNLCPSGWHVPTDTQWTTLTNYLGGNPTAGIKMAEEGNMHWINSWGTNSSNFTGLPGGFRSGGDGTFSQLNWLGSWWSSTELQAGLAWGLELNNGSGSSQSQEGESEGLSVRCIKN